MKCNGGANLLLDIGDGRSQDLDLVREDFQLLLHLGRLLVAGLDLIDALVALVLTFTCAKRARHAGRLT